jgi:putative solute:sodium symporter small subunit
MTAETETDDDRVATDGGLSDVERERQIDYLEVEINLLKPATPFMRDHNRAILTGFVAWAIIVFGPITATRIAPDLMTQSIPALGFPLHYFLIAIGAPTGALLLSVWYARKRDKIDEKYGIEQMQAPEPDATDAGAEGATATDGGVSE